MFHRRVAAFVVAICVLVSLAGSATADPFTFGVISDTQDTIGTGINSVPTNIIAAVNQQFINNSVRFVLQPGDLGDNGSVASLQSRLDANASLTAAGIPFYGLRGNHEDNSAGLTFFKNNYIPTSTSTLTVNVDPVGGLNYSITYQGTTIVMLDITTADSTANMNTATTWLNGVLSTDGHQQAFVLQHKNLLGQNHKDNAFGSGNDSNPTQQNNFFQALATNGVRYDISGHDHMNHRSNVSSPNGQYKVEQIISQSDSTKYYTASSGFSTREQSISDQQNKIGYYLYTVDGPKVTGQYFATPPAANGDIQANPVWTLQDTFGYSLNGKQVTVARSDSYAGITDSTDLAISRGETGYRGTRMQILAGTNNVTATAEGNRSEVEDLNTGWTPISSAGSRGLSDVLTLWGMNNGLGSPETDPFVLSLSFDGTAVSFHDGVVGNVVVGERDSLGNWVNAVDLNFGGAPHFVLGAYDATYSLGTYGVDPGTETAWAVVNNTGDFAVINTAAVAVPEPATLGFLALGGLSMLGARLRRRRSQA